MILCHKQGILNNQSLKIQINKHVIRVFFFIFYFPVYFEFSQLKDNSFTYANNRNLVCNILSIITINALIYNFDVLQVFLLLLN